MKKINKSCSNCKFNLAVDEDDYEDGLLQELAHDEHMEKCRYCFDYSNWKLNKLGVEI